MRSIVFVLAALAAACSSKSSSPPSSSGAPAAPATKRFAIPITASDEKIEVDIALPATWTADVSGGDPSFQLEDANIFLLGLVAIAPNGDAAERMEKAIRLQYGDGANAKREPLSGGRVWMQEPNEKNGGVHARIFVPFDGGVVMGVAMLSGENADRLPEIRKTFESIAIAKP